MNTEKKNGTPYGRRKGLKSEKKEGNTIWKEKRTEIIQLATFQVKGGNLCIYVCTEVF